MSESTSFLGGAAFAGLAALVLLKGGVTVGAPNVGGVQSLSAPTVSPSVVAQPVVSPSPTVSPEGANPEDVEQLKTLVEQQKTDIEKLRTQVQDQKVAIDTLTTQLKVNTPPANSSSAQVLSTDEQLANPILTGLLWALGGVVLALGGGLSLVGMFVLVAKQQQQNRSPHTVEVIHTAHEVPSYMPSRRRPVLPARRVVAKRANPPEYD
jgi:hypothetical protein